MQSFANKDSSNLG